MTSECAGDSAGGQCRFAFADMSASRSHRTRERIAGRGWHSRRVKNSCASTLINSAFTDFLGYFSLRDEMSQLEMRRNCNRGNITDGKLESPPRSVPAAAFTVPPSVRVNPNCLVGCLLSSLKIVADLSRALIQVNVSARLRVHECIRNSGIE